MCRGLSSPALFHTGSSTVGQVIAAFDVVLKDLNTTIDWPELLWISEKM